MGKTATSRPPGRPKDEEKRTAIVDAARQLFIAHTYDSVTMEQVARAAGVAKMTIYGHFHDKESVFEAMVESISASMTAALPALPAGEGNLEEELFTFGYNFLTVLLSPGVIYSFHRNFDMLARNRPLAERFYNAGPGRTRTTLAAYLASAAASTDLPIEMGDEAASDLLSLWVGDIPQQIAFGLVPPITPDKIARRVRRCTRLFLRAYGLIVANERRRGTSMPARLT